MQTWFCLQAWRKGSDNLIMLVKPGYFHTFLHDYGSAKVRQDCSWKVNLKYWWNALTILAFLIRIGKWFLSLCLENTDTSAAIGIKPFHIGIHHGFPLLWFTNRLEMCSVSLVRRRKKEIHLLKLLIFLETGMHSLFATYYTGLTPGDVNLIILVKPKYFKELVLSPRVK